MVGEAINRGKLAIGRYEGRDAYSHGVFDHDRGKTWTSNPYDPGTRRWQDWEDGFWTAAEAATDDAMEKQDG